jgi:hypothetical protein
VEVQRFADGTWGLNLIKTYEVTTEAALADWARKPVFSGLCQSRIRKESGVKVLAVSADVAKAAFGSLVTMLMVNARPA